MEIQDRPRAPDCRYCGTPLLGELGDSCWKCRQRKPLYHRCFCAGVYREEWKILIQRYKLQGERSLRKVLAPHLEAFIPLGAVLIPVPGNPGNNHKRGFDPALDLGKLLCRGRKRHLLKAFIRRQGRSQKSLGRQDREENLGQTITLRPLPALEEVWLLDDVMTTGATARQCSRMLLAAGVRKVYLAVLAGP